MHDYKEIILIGAPRSGTNMLRDVIARLDGFGTWPCDEINYIWRHGNRSHLTDEFDAELATPEVKKFIQGRFDRLAQQKSLEHVIEKTCANSLRVAFIDRIFPEARYIFLVRDGRDAIASAMKRWKVPLDITYTLRKARFVPLRDLPYYGIKFIRNRFLQLISEERKMTYWGPIFEGMDTMLEERSLPDVCAAQWKNCVNNSERNLSEIVPKRVCRVQYETFVSKPIQELKRIATFLGVRDEQNYHRAVANVDNRYIGKWQNDLSDRDLDIVMPYIKDELIRYGYSNV